MFAHRTGRSTGLVGRNFDNRDTQVLAGWFYPTNGYASVALLPLSDLGYTPDDPFDPASEQNRRTLLYAPVMAIEGMNEKGVTVTLASLGRREVTLVPGRESRFLIHLVREILDQAASVNEAVSIAEKYNIFDNGAEVISHHIFLTDPHSGSGLRGHHRRSAPGLVPLHAGPVPLQPRAGIRTVAPALVGGPGRLRPGLPEVG